MPTSSAPSMTPSARPTISTPTELPSVMPTSSAPSISPSNSPTELPSVMPTSSAPSMTPSAVPTVSSPTELPSSMPTTSAPIQTQSVTRVDDFSSKAAMISDGWKFVNEHPGLDFIATRPSHFCQGVPDASFCGFAFPAELALQYTFSTTGKAVFDWGQSWAGGFIRLYKNGIEIDSRFSNGAQTTEFDVSMGDVLEIRELGITVINIHSLTITSNGNGAPDANSDDSSNPTDGSSDLDTNPTGVIEVNDFSSVGRAVLEWGQSWNGGSVTVTRNGFEIDSRNTFGSQTSEFDVIPGDVLEIREHDTSVINIHGLTITPLFGRRELTGRLLD